MRPRVAALSTHSDLSIGVDFGTTNTVVAVSDADGKVDTVRFDSDGDKVHVFQSILCFWEDLHKGTRHTQVEGGPWAIEQYLDGLGLHRLIQSFKSFAASRSFEETRIFRQKFQFEDLLATFLRTLLRHSGSILDGLPATMVVGRPVRFAGNKPDDALAMNRYRSSFLRLEISNPIFVYEPVAAAFYFAQRLDADATVLVADFGGGTSDFSVIHFARDRLQLRPRPLGNAGVAIAGDTFDYRIIDAIVAPRLGKGGQYQSFGKILSVPNGYFSNFARWNQLAMMKSSGELRDIRKLAKLALDPAPLLKLAEFIENDWGFSMYRSVSNTKIALSSQQETDFIFQQGDIDIRAKVSRAEFEEWIRDDVQQISDTVEAALNTAGVRSTDIDRVFLTGGSSFIPVITQIFIERFGLERIDSGNQFESIASGLALIGRSPELSQWIARPTEY